MTNSKCLKTDLVNCLISFDRETLVTDLLEEYELSFQEINDILLDYFKKDENKNHVKYNKRYIVSGEEVLQSNSINDDHTEVTVRKIYTITPEEKLQQQLKRLKKAYSVLYSVERLGGAKSPANVFKPIKLAKDIELRQDISTVIPNMKFVEPKSSLPSKKAADTTDSEKNSVKKPVTNEILKTPKAITNKKNNNKSISLTTSLLKESPKFGGINKMFKSTSSSLNLSLTNGNDVGKGNQQTLNISPEENEKNKEKKPLNNSISVFSSNEEENTSSDDEEKMEAIRKEILVADADIGLHDTIDSGSKKRSRRILDSDSDSDDETNRNIKGPPIKQEKLEEKVPATFMDDDGFLVTVKAKESKIGNNYKSIEPVKDEKQPVQLVKTETLPSLLTKKKQTGIMNYFSKK